MPVRGRRVAGRVALARGAPLAAALSALSLLLGPLAARAAAGDEAHLLARVPADAAVVLALPGLDATLARAASSDALARLADSPLAAPVADALAGLADGRAALGEVALALGLDGAAPAALASLLARDAVLVGLAGDRPGALDPIALAALDVRALAERLATEPSGLAAALAARLGAAPAGAPAPGEPALYRLAAISGRPLARPLFAAIDGGTLILGFAEGPVRRALARTAEVVAARGADGAAPPLAAVAALRLLPPGGAEDGAPAPLAWLAAGAGAPLPGALARFARIEARLGARAETSARAGALVADLALEPALGAQPPFADGADAAAPAPPVAPRLLPGATVLAAGGRLSASDALALARATLAPPDQEALARALADLGERLGAPLEPDLAAALGGEHAVALVRQRALAGAQAAPAIALILAVRDRAPLEGALARLVREHLTAPPDIPPDERGDHPTYRRKEGLAGGVTAHLVEPPRASGTLERMGGTVLPGYAFVGDRLVVTTGAALLDAAADHAAGAASGLAGSPRFAATAALAPGGSPLAWLHVDVEGLIDLLREHEEPLAGFFAPPVDAAEDPAPPPPGSGPRAYERWREEVEAARAREREAAAEAAAQARAAVARSLEAAGVVAVVRGALWREPGAIGAGPAAPALPTPAEAPPAGRLRGRLVIELR